jgi:hypothetical protein
MKKKTTALQNQRLKLRGMEEGEEEEEEGEEEEEEGRRRRGSIQNA